MVYKTAYAEKVYETKKRLEFRTITSDVRDFVSSSGIENGIVTVQTHHTTACLFINEDEKNLIGPGGDIGKIMDRFASPDDEWGHNDIKDASNPKGKRDTHLCGFDKDGNAIECINGHSHAQAMLFHPSITLIIKDGTMILGKWQEIMLVELDHNRERKVSIMVQGDDE